MATRLYKTVKPSGGDYTSLEACMHANEQDLVSADKYFDVEIDGDWSSADTSPVTIHNYTTDATHFINIYTTETARHTGKYDTTKYRIEMNQWLINIQCRYVRITGLQVRDTSGGGADQCIIEGNASGADADIRIVGNIIKASSAGGVGYGIYIGGDLSGGTVNVWNNVIHGAGQYGIRAGGGGGYTHNIFNNTIINCGYGIVNTAGTTNATNNYASATTACYSGTITKLTTASSDTSGSTGLQSIDCSTSSGAYFTNVTAGSEDLHIGASSALKDAGTDLSATFTTDIDFATRSGAWDIGADEIAGATSGIKSVGGVAYADVGKVSGVSKASISKIDGLS